MIPNLGDQAAIDDAKEVVKTTAKVAPKVLKRPVRWAPLLLTALGVGALLSVGAPLWRIRPVRRVAKAGTLKLLLHLAKR